MGGSSYPCQPLPSPCPALAAKTIKTQGGRQAMPFISAASTAKVLASHVGHWFLGQRQRIRGLDKLVQLFGNLPTEVPMHTWSLDTGERLQHTYGLQVTHLITNCIRPVFGSLFPASDIPRPGKNKHETMWDNGNIWIDIYIYMYIYIYVCVCVCMYVYIYIYTYIYINACGNIWFSPDLSPLGQLSHRSLEAWKRPSTQVGTADGEGVSVDGLQRYCHGFLFLHLALESQWNQKRETKWNKKHTTESIEFTYCFFLFYSSKQLLDCWIKARMNWAHWALTEQLSSTPAWALERTGYSWRAASSQRSSSASNRGLRGCPWWGCIRFEKL